MYDLIGDIHGCAGSLQRLLTDQLGYRIQDGVPRPAESGRQAIFVGDLIDRGPDSPGVYRLVRAMVERGDALVVLGNHELNALAWHTEDPQRPGTPLRAHNEHHRRQYAGTLQAFAGRPAELDEMIAWFHRIPLWLDLDGLRVIHACWQPDAMATLSPWLDRDRAIPDVHALAGIARDPNSPTFQALETILKGVEATLPDGLAFHDKEGRRRHQVRVRWWALDQGPQTWPAVAFGSDDLIHRLPDTPAVLPDAVGYPADAPPVFIGHYWLDPTLRPAPLRPNVACLDYSVALGGPLVAYTWRGEYTLNPAHFVVQRHADGLG